MANITLIPSVLMILFSCLLIGSIFKARGRVRLNNSEREKKRLKQDVKFTISLLTMNLLFILLTLPTLPANIIAITYLDAYLVI